MAIDSPNQSDSAVTELQAEIVAARADLLDSIAALKSQANGQAMAQRAAASVRRWFVDASGAPRIDHIAVVGGVVVGVVLLRALGRRR